MNGEGINNTEKMSILSETDLANQPEKIRLRRDENTLSVVGSGVIVFGIWSVVKALLHGNVSYSNMLEVVRLEDAGLEELGFGDLSWVVAAAAVVLVLLVLFLDLAIRIYVGMSARAECKGEKQGRAYLVLSVLLLFLSGVYICSFVMVLFSGSDQVMDADAAILVELTSFVTLLQMIISAVRVRRARRAEQEKG